MSSSVFPDDDTIAPSAQARYRAMPVLAEGAQAPQSAVSWGAIFAGAAAAAALSLILLILGTGLGLSSVSPWAQNGVSATTFGITTVIWITFTQLAASGIGGYLAGRLRTRWVDLHTDEVYFRDTAHGFLAWAVASLVTAAALTTAVGAIVSGTAQAGAAVAGGAATVATAGAAVGGAAAAGSQGGAMAGPGGMSSSPTSYFVDTLFRRDASASSAPSTSNGTGTAAMPAPAVPAMAPMNPPDGGGASTQEVGRIFANAIRTGGLSTEDSRYVAQLVAQRTGISQQDAEKRVTDTYNKLQAKLRDAEAAAKDAADKARKASAYAALWIFISLLLGAFVASLFATMGGRQRDVY